MKNDMKYENIERCPFCESSQFSYIYENKNIVRCDSCNLVYPNKRLTEESLYKLYQDYAKEGSHMSIPNNLEEVKCHGLQRQYMMEKILKYKQTGKILDIGCGWGGFLFNARNNNFYVYGVELTENCVKYGNNILNIPIFNVDINTTTLFKDGMFDVVIMNHTLEHMTNQKRTLRRIYDLLSNGGIFIGIVPNFNSLCSKCDKDKWEWLDSHYHYVHYTPLTLKNTFMEMGFDVMEIETAMDDYNYNKLKYVIQQVYGISEEESVKKQINRLSKLNLGEAIIFVVKKV